MNLEIQMFLQLALAFILGSLIGLEREIKGKEAGLQTYSLVSLGSCLFAIVSTQLFSYYLANFGTLLDPSIVIRAVAVGIGFLGAGVIFQRPARIEGLTTAAGLWVSAAIGMTIGFEMYFLATLCTLFVILILAGVGTFEKKFFKSLLKNRK